MISLRLGFETDVAGQYEVSSSGQVVGTRAREVSALFSLHLFDGNSMATHSQR